MKKRACLFILLSIVLLSSCSMPFAAQPVRYTSLEEITQLPSSMHISGISPDGQYVFCVNESELNAFPLSVKPGETGDELAAAMTLPVNKRVLLPSKKRLQWSADGKSFLFSDVDYASYELQTMNSRNISLFTVEGNKITYRAVTDLDTITGILKGGSLPYAPSFSADGKAVVYSIIGEESGVYRTDLSSGKTKKVYAVQGHQDVDCLEVKQNLYFCVINGRKADEGCNIFFVDKDGKTKQVENAEMGLEDGRNLLDVKAWSEDRRTLLLTRRNTQDKGAYDAFFIMRIGNGANDYKVEAYPVDEGMFLYNAQLSPDGSFAVTCESKETVSLASDNSQTKQLTLYDLSSGKKTPLYSSDEIFGFISPLNANLESIYITKNGKLLVWFGEGYKLFQLK